MRAYDPILAADLAEEKCATDALLLATSKDELVSIWWRDADHFGGEARERLQEVYAKKLAELAPLGRAG